MKTVFSYIKHLLKTLSVGVLAISLSLFSVVCCCWTHTVQAASHTSVSSHSAKHAHCHPQETQKPDQSKDQSSCCRVMSADSSPDQWEASNNFAFNVQLISFQGMTSGDAWGLSISASSLASTSPSQFSTVVAHYLKHSSLRI